MKDKKVIFKKCISCETSLPSELEFYLNDGVLMKSQLMEVFPPAPRYQYSFVRYADELADKPVIAYFITIDIKSITDSGFYMSVAYEDMKDPTGYEMLDDTIVDLAEIKGKIYDYIKMIIEAEEERTKY